MEFFRISSRNSRGITQRFLKIQVGTGHNDFMLAMSTHFFMVGKLFTFEYISLDVVLSGSETKGVRPR